MLRRVAGLTWVILCAAAPVSASPGAARAASEQAAVSAAAPAVDGWGRAPGTPMTGEQKSGAAPAPTDGWGSGAAKPGVGGAAVSRLAPVHEDMAVRPKPATGRGTAPARRAGDVTPARGSARKPGGEPPGASLRWDVGPAVEAGHHAVAPAWQRLVWEASASAAAEHLSDVALVPAARVQWQTQEGYVVPDRPAAMPPAAAGAATAPAQATIDIVAGAARPQVPGLTRWVDLSTATVSARYRTITNSRDIRTINQMQDQQAIKVRLKVDPAGHYSVNVGAFTGNNFIASWNNTGVGTGDLFKAIYVKQLYFDAVPAPGLDFQYGSLYLARGESTEITSYDNDGFVMGLRASVKRPKSLFFDEISATQGYLGDATRASVFDRTDRLAEANYWQGLVARRIGAYVTTSADLTRALEVDTVRAALTVRPKGRRPVDLVRVESYRRLAAGAVPAATGFALYGERAFTRRVVAGGGWADIDPAYGGLNADRFNRGRRLFTNGTVTLSPELTVQAFYTLAVDNTVAIANKTRLDVILTYNLLRTLQRTGRF